MDWNQVQREAAPLRCSSSGCCWAVFGAGMPGEADERSVSVSIVDQFRVVVVVELSLEEYWSSLGSRPRSDGPVGSSL